MTPPWIYRAAVLAIMSASLSACKQVPQRPEPAPDTLATATDVDCPDVTRLSAGQLYGSWVVQFPQTGQSGTLTLRQHPEFSASLRGEFKYSGHTSIASGDVENGEFNLDESRDGKSLFAFWNGKLIPSACGTEIRGTWQIVPAPGQPEKESPFVLHRPASRDAD
jgi:hypothetical protein